MFFVQVEYEQTEQAYKFEIENQQQMKIELESLQKRNKSSIADIGNFVK